MILVAASSFWKPKPNNNFSALGLLLSVATIFTARYLSRKNEAITIEKHHVQVLYKYSLDFIRFIKNLLQDFVHQSKGF
jgi:hypothetical protein